MAIANTAAGNTVTATSNTDLASLTNADNTLEFTFTPAAGTYKIEAQRLSNTAGEVISTNSGNAVANLVISSAVSNTLSTFIV